jgi:predicted S18 family serine protease
MATPAQIAANQANAKHSTGPRTETGKAATRKNASRHGLCSTIPGLYAEDADATKALLADLMQEHQPQGPTEEILVYKMAEQFRLTKRASYYLAMHTDASQDGDNTKQIALFLRYYTAADRAFNRNLNELRKIQKERRQQEAETPIGSVPQNVEPAPAPDLPTAPQPAPLAPVEQISVETSVDQAPIDCAGPREQAA